MGHKIIIYNKFKIEFENFKPVALLGVYFFKHIPIVLTS